MMKITLAALLSLQAATLGSAFSVAGPSFVRQSTTTTSLNSKRAGAAASFEEDLMLTLKVIMDHQERSTTASKDQFISQMEESKKLEESKPEPIDISIPYDAAAKLAYEASDKSMKYEDFKVKFEADAVADVIAKKSPSAPVAAKKETPAAVDLSIPYDAAAKLAYEASDKSMKYEDFKTQFEADAVADVIAKKAPSAPAAAAKKEAPAAVDLSIPYDAAAKLAYETSDKSMKYDEFKAQFEADAVADVIAKQKKPEAVAA